MTVIFWWFSCFSKARNLSLSVSLAGVWCSAEAYKARCGAACARVAGKGEGEATKASKEGGKKAKNRGPSVELPAKAKANGAKKLDAAAAA